MQLQKFGIEIRKIGNVQNLYKDVDAVLGKMGPGCITASVQTDTVAHALQKMITGPHFSVCTVDDCAKLSGLTIQADRRKIYSAIHCLSWNEMEPQYRQTILAMILDDFRPILNPAA